MVTFKSHLKYLFILPLAFILSILFFFDFALTRENIDQKGIVTYVEGSAKKRKITVENWAPVKRNTEVFGGDRVRTFSRSRAELELAKLDKIRMAPQTTIDILKLYEETKEQIRESKIVLQKGDLWANVAKKSKNLKFSIGTPVAAAAITGTTLRLGVKDDSSSIVKVYNGEVVLTNAPESQAFKQKTMAPHEIEGPHEVPGPREVSLDEWVLIVKSMQMVKVDKNGKVSYQGDFSLDDPDEKSDWVLWNRKMDQLEKR